MFSKPSCKRCEGKLKDDFSFCPFCGLDLRNPHADMRDYGLLGKNDAVLGAPMLGGGAIGMNDPAMNGLFANIMKMMEHQLKNIDPEQLDSVMKEMHSEIQRLPNGIKISFGPKPVHQPKQQPQPRVITDEQRARMTKLPRAEAKTNIRRFSDHVVYSLDVPGLTSVNDVFVSKVESGYEVKAIGKNKVFVNSLQLNLPIKKYSVKDERLSLEFGLH
jgi:hypothetical protein